jgi:polyferredoxin
VRLVPRFETMTWLRIAVVLTLAGLALMLWSMLQPTPLPVMLAMTVGQGVGTTAFVIYAVIAIQTLRRERRGTP